MVNNELITKYLQKGQFEKAIKEYTAYLDSSGIKDKDQTYANILNALGDVLVKANKIDDAYNRFCAAAEIYINHCYYSNASAVLKKCLRFKPSAIDLKYRLGEVACLTQSFHEAEQYFTDYAQFYFSQNNVSEALRALEKITQINPDKIEYKIRLAEAYRLTNSIDKMFTAYHTAFVFYKQTQDERLHELMGTIIAIAIKSNYLTNPVFLNIVVDYLSFLYETGASVLAGNTVIDLCNRLETDANFELSEQLLLSALQKDINSIPLHVKLLDNYDKSGMVEKSIPHYIALGVLLIPVNVGQAEKIFKKALSLNPSNPEILRYFTPSMEFIPNPDLKEKDDVVLTLSDTATEPIMIETASLVTSHGEIDPSNLEPISVTDVFEQYTANLAHSVLNALPDDVSPEIQSIFEDFKSGVAEQLGEDPGSHYAMGICYKEMSFYSEAINEFRLALNSKEYQLQALNMIASCYTDSGDFDSAIEIYHDVLAISSLPEYAIKATCFSLAITYFLQNKIFDSYELFKKISDPASFARDPHYKNMLDSYLSGSFLTQENYAKILTYEAPNINYDDFIDTSLDDALGATGLKDAEAFFAEKEMTELPSIDLHAEAIDAPITPTPLPTIVDEEKDVAAVGEETIPSDLITVESDFDSLTPFDSDHNHTSDDDLGFEFTIESDDIVEHLPTLAEDPLQTHADALVSNSNTNLAVESNVSVPPEQKDSDIKKPEDKPITIENIVTKAEMLEYIASLTPKTEQPSLVDLHLLEKAFDDLREAQRAGNERFHVHYDETSNKISQLTQSFKAFSASVDTTFENLKKSFSEYDTITAMMHKLQNKLQILESEIISPEELADKILTSKKITGIYKEILDVNSALTTLKKELLNQPPATDVSGLISDIQSMQLDLSVLPTLRENMLNLEKNNAIFSEALQKTRKDIVAFVTDYKKLKNFTHENIAPLVEFQKSTAIQIQTFASTLDVLSTQQNDLAQQNEKMIQRIVELESTLSIAASNREIENKRYAELQEHYETLKNELESIKKEMDTSTSHQESLALVPHHSVSVDRAPYLDFIPEQEHKNVNIGYIAPAETIPRRAVAKKSRISFI